MHDALGDALVVEVRDLLAQDEVFQQRRPAQRRPSASSGCRRSARPGWWSARWPPESTRTRSSGSMVALTPSRRDAAGLVGAVVLATACWPSAGARPASTRGAGWRRRGRWRSRVRPAWSGCAASPRPAPATCGHLLAGRHRTARRVTWLGPLSVLRAADLAAARLAGLAGVLVDLGMASRWGGANVPNAPQARHVPDDGYPCGPGHPPAALERLPMDYSRYSSLNVTRRGPDDSVLDVQMKAQNGKLATADHNGHRELAQVWRDIGDDPEVRAVVLRGEGKGFSAGGDFSLVEDMANDFEVRSRVWREARDLVYNVINCDKPIVIGDARARGRRRAGRGTARRHPDRRPRRADRRRPHPPRRRSRRPCGDHLAAALRHGQGQVLPAAVRAGHRRGSRAHRLGGARASTTPSCATRPCRSPTRLATSARQTRDSLDQVRAQQLVADDGPDLRHLAGGRVHGLRAGPTSRKAWPRCGSAARRSSSAAPRRRFEPAPACRATRAGPGP